MDLQMRRAQAFGDRDLLPAVLRDDRRVLHILTEIIEGGLEAGLLQIARHAHRLGRIAAGHEAPRDRRGRTVALHPARDARRARQCDHPALPDPLHVMAPYATRPRTASSTSLPPSSMTTPPAKRSIHSLAPR